MTFVRSLFYHFLRVGKNCKASRRKGYLLGMVCSGPGDEIISAIHPCRILYVVLFPRLTADKKKTMCNASYLIFQTQSQSNHRSKNFLNSRSRDRHHSHGRVQQLRVGFLEKSGPFVSYRVIALDGGVRNGRVCSETGRRFKAGCLICFKKLCPAPLKARAL